MNIPDQILVDHHVLVATDNPFQRRARLLQALWREDRGYPIGERRPSVPLGSRLQDAFAKDGANFMTDAARAAARRELASMHAGSGQKIDEKRLWSNLLSSQPLAFNLFAELGENLDLAARVLGRLWPGRVSTVSKVAFEYSPGRSDPKYTLDRTAFDVYIEHLTPGGGRAFIGIEVKYHEALGDEPAEFRSRYDEISRGMGCFSAEGVARVRRKPIEQIWRDHMLCGAMLLDKPAGWETGLYVFMYPTDNDRCRDAVQRYKECLTDARSFEGLTLERIVEAIEAETEAQWIRELRKRYLGWDRLPR